MYGYSAGASSSTVGLQYHDFFFKCIFILFMDIADCTALCVNQMHGCLKKVYPKCLARNICGTTGNLLKIKKV